MVSAARAAVFAVLLPVIGCNYGLEETKTADQNRPPGYVWQVPEGFPIPRVPADNPMTWDKVELGRQLFYDPRLSGDGTVSCATCHQPGRAFTDGRNRAVGIAGNIHPRSAMSLTNVAYNATLGWDDPNLTRLEDQILVPLYNTQPPEMGVANREEEILVRFKKDHRMRRLFQRAFTEEHNPITMRCIIYALAAFERTLVSGNSAYDRWAYGGQADALDVDQRAGARLFFSQRLNCFRCHAGFNFSGPVVYEGSDFPEARFHNTGLYNEDGRGAYPEPNTGLHRHTGIDDDMGKFRAPTLRNIALTAPYMHDGSIPTLEAVLDHYAAGGRSRFAPYLARKADAGAAIDSLMTGFDLAPDEKRKVIAFLHALTDKSFVEQVQAQAVR